MASITSWNRLEPLPRTGDLAPALEARTADPLWFLARQWQVLEFAGEDAGSPVVARITARQSALGQLVLGPDGGPVVSVDDRVAPLETMIEAEPADIEDHERLRVETGMHLMRMLTAGGRTDAASAFVTAFRFEPGHQPAGRQGTGFRTIATGRAPDGARIAAALVEARAGDGTLSALPPGIDVGADVRDEVLAIAARWLEWYDALVTSGLEAGWDSMHLEYSASVRSRTDEGVEVLAVEEYADGRLDWYSFSRRPLLDGVAGGSEPGSSTLDGTPGPETVTRTVIPVPASYAGMPADRFWEFEHGRVNLGAVDAGPTDLSRLALVEFALVYGNDWFVLPLDLRSGSLCTITRLEVVDTFGEVVEIPSIPADENWGLFELTVEGDAPSRLLLPPVVAGTVDGDPIESVSMVRDEMANMAWAVERTVSEPTGDVVDRTETITSPSAGWDHVGDLAPDGVPAYRLMTPVPEHWLPLVPVPDADGGEGVVLERRTMRRQSPTGPVDVEPLGRILRPGSQLSIDEGAVPRSGVTVERAWQLARWTDGSTHLWIGRRRRVGRGEGHSGLRFDVVDTPPSAD